MASNSAIRGSVKLPIGCIDCLGSCRNSAGLPRIVAESPSSEHVGAPPFYPWCEAGPLARDRRGALKRDVDGGTKPPSPTFANGLLSAGYVPPIRLGSIGSALPMRIARWRSARRRKKWQTAGLIRNRGKPIPTITRRKLVQIACAIESLDPRCVPHRMMRLCAQFRQPTSPIRYWIVIPLWGWTASRQQPIPSSRPSRARSPRTQMLARGARGGRGSDVTKIKTVQLHTQTIEVT